jgi:UDP-2-acetamido-2,6-beta-L-arabino-hexul-4-ose reductase
MKVGITGSSGFIGYHTYHTLRLTTDWEVIALDRKFWEDTRIKECDWIIHLAGQNRGEPQDVYHTNVYLAHRVKEAVNADCGIIFASSTHVDNLPDLPSKQLSPNEAYGAGKLEAEHILHEHKSFRIPNVFGEFCKPNYNSFVATFAHKVCTGVDIAVQDSYVKLTHVSDVVNVFKYYINHRQSLPFRSQTLMVSEVLKRFTHWHTTYSQGGQVPDFSNPFDLKLFNTFRSYIPRDKKLFPTTPHTDDRGTLTEVVEIKPSEGKVFTSTTNPGFTRGGHFHLRKFERFCVVSGNATIRMRRVGTSEILGYDVSGDKIEVIDMPTFYTHDITNTGTDVMTALFWTTVGDTDNYWEAV